MQSLWINKMSEIIFMRGKLVIRQVIAEKSYQFCLSFKLLFPAINTIYFYTPKSVFETSRRKHSNTDLEKHGNMSFRLTDISPNVILPNDVSPNAVLPNAH